MAGTYKDTTLRLKIAIPLIRLYNPEKQHGSYMRRALDDLLSLDKQVSIILLKLGEFYPRLYLEEQDPQKEAYPFSPAILSIEIEVNPEQQKIILSTLPFHAYGEEERYDLFIAELAHDFHLRIFYLLLLGQIAKPGSIKSKQGWVLVNGKKIERFYSLCSIRKASMISGT